MSSFRRCYILNVFMVITSTISVHHRLHCVRINPSRAFGMHALNAFLSYNRVCEVRLVCEVSGLVLTKLAAVDDGTQFAGQYRLN